MVVRACKQCKTIVNEGNKCPECGSEELTDSYKGKVIILNPEKSEVAKNLKHSKKGTFAVKLG